MTASVLSGTISVFEHGDYSQGLIVQPDRMAVCMEERIRKTWLWQENSLAETPMTQA